jgi:hypothetical protein
VGVKSSGILAMMVSMREYDAWVSRHAAGVALRLFGFSFQVRGSRSVGSVVGGRKSRKERHMRSRDGGAEHLPVVDGDV